MMAGELIIIINSLVFTLKLLFCVFELNLITSLSESQDKISVAEKNIAALLTTVSKEMSF